MILKSARLKICCWSLCLLAPWALSGQTNRFLFPMLRESTKPAARVVIVRDPEATEAFQPRPEIVRALLNRGLATLTGKLAPGAAWRTLVSTQDIVGIKVYSSPGPTSGTRVSVVAAVIEGLLEAKIPKNQIIVWDKLHEDLRQAGFFELAARYDIRVESSGSAGYDENVFYSPDAPILGHVVWGDLEFGRSGDGVARKSYV